MKFKIIFRTYLISALIVAILGVFQFSRYIESDTGFFIRANNRYGLFISVVAVGIILLVAALSLFVRRCPLKQPSVDIFISSISFFLSVFLILKIVFSLKEEQISVLPIILDLICLLYFIMYASKAYLVINISEYFSVIPLLYWVANLVISYLQISKIKLIPENAYMVIANAANALFMLYYSKLCCKAESDNIHKRILVSGIIASLFDILFSVSGLYMSISEKQETVHNEPVMMCVYLFTGIFIMAFIRNFFSNRNLARHHMHSGSRNIIPHDNINENAKNIPENYESPLTDAEELNENQANND